MLQRLSNDEAHPLLQYMPSGGLTERTSSQCGTMLNICELHVRWDDAPPSFHSRPSSRRATWMSLASMCQSFHSMSGIVVVVRLVPALSPAPAVTPTSHQRHLTNVSAAAKVSAAAHVPMGSELAADVPMGSELFSSRRSMCCALAVCPAPTAASPAASNGSIVHRSRSLHVLK